MHCCCCAAADAAAPAAAALTNQSRARRRGLCIWSEPHPPAFTAPPSASPPCSCGPHALQRSPSPTPSTRALVPHLCLQHCCLQLVQLPPQHGVLRACALCRVLACKGALFGRCQLARHACCAGLQLRPAPTSASCVRARVCVCVHARAHMCGSVRQCLLPIPARCAPSALASCRARGFGATILPNASSARTAMRAPRPLQGRCAHCPPPLPCPRTLRAPTPCPSCGAGPPAGPPWRAAPRPPRHPPARQPAAGRPPRRTAP